MDIIYLLVGFIILIKQSNFFLFKGEGKEGVGEGGRELEGER